MLSKGEGIGVEHRDFFFPVMAAASNKGMSFDCLFMMFIGRSVRGSFCLSFGGGGGVSFGWFISKTCTLPSDEYGRLNRLSSSKSMEVDWGGNTGVEGRKALFEVDFLFCLVFWANPHNAEYGVPYF